MRTGTIFAMIEEVWPCRATDKGKQLSLQEQPMQGTNLPLWQTSAHQTGMDSTLASLDHVQ